jgi:hypothetical protein
MVGAAVCTEITYADGEHRAKECQMSSAEDTLDKVALITFPADDLAG